MEASEKLHLKEKVSGSIIIEMNGQKFMMDACNFFVNDAKEPMMVILCQDKSNPDNKVQFTLDKSSEEA